MAFNYSKAIFLFAEDDARALLVDYQPKIENAGPDADPRHRDNWKMVKTLDPDIKKGDFVVVETDTRWGMTVVRVCETDVEPDLDEDEPIKWVVGKSRPGQLPAHQAAGS